MPNYRDLVNTDKGVTAANPFHPDLATAVLEMGFSGVASDVETVGFLPTTYASGTYRTTNIDTVLESYAGEDRVLIVVLYHAVISNSSYNTAQTSTNVSGQLAFANGKRICTRNAAFLAQIVTDWCAFDLYIQNKWLELGGKAENLFIQFGGREPGSGGAAGVNSNDGTTYTDFLASFTTEGRWDRNSDWDAVALATGNSKYGDVLGHHEAMNAFYASCTTLPGVRRISPSFEHQIPNHWGYATPAALLGPSTIADEERSTCVYDGFTTWWNGVDFVGLDVYCGSWSTKSHFSPRQYADACFEFITTAKGYIESELTLYSINTKEIFVTECGFACPWINYGSKTADQIHRGQIFKAIRDMGQKAPVFGFVLYRMKNYASGDDALSSNTSFGLITSTGNMSAGALALYSQGGTSYSASGTDPVGGTWQSGSTSS